MANEEKEGDIDVMKIDPKVRLFVLALNQNNNKPEANTKIPITDTDKAVSYKIDLKKASKNNFSL